MQDALRYAVLAVDTEQTVLFGPGPRVETSMGTVAAFERLADAQALYRVVTGPKRLVAVLAESLGR